MAKSGRSDRRAFLRSAASLAVGGLACHRRKAGGVAASDGGPDGIDAREAEAQAASGLDSVGEPDRGGEGPVAGEAGMGTEAGAGGEAAVSRRPNLLFILADQWRAQAMGWAGDVNARTPVLDALARESVTFAHAVSCAPVCGPYRATLMTGRYPTETGVFVNDVNLAQDPNALARQFKQAGYDTGYIGKWHLDGQGCRLAYTPPERRQGFERWAAIECTHDYNNSVYYAGQNGVDRLTWPGYDAIAQTREMQRWLSERDQATPFCYFLSWGPPHDPYGTAPPELAAQLAAAAIELRPNVPAAYAEEARANLAGYYAHLAALDGCLGDLLGTLDGLGIADDTILVFTSDHGDMHRSQGQLWKGQPWDESILVPLLVRYPAGLGRGARTLPTAINTPDLLPTLLGLARLPCPVGMRGRDLSPVLRQEAAPDDEPALIMCVSPFGNWSRARGGKEYRGLRTSRFTYARDLAGPWLLYDNVADPYQMTNLVDRADQAGLKANLDAQLAARLQTIGDPFREAAYYVGQWGYTVDASDGSVPTAYTC